MPDKLTREQIKCMAARVDESSQDRDDAEFLIRKLSLTNDEAVFECIERFYPAERIHIKTRYFVSEIVTGMNRGPDIGGGVRI